MDAACDQAYQRCAASRPGLDQAGPRTRALIEKWGMLHAVRTTLGALLATLAYLWACMARLKVKPARGYLYAIRPP